ncbi:MAG: hypothetical protein KGI25_00345 [Thaumarchaeota archaeon]|nr:hypothetical protein [Nitrososphaerota archaeon]
MALRCNICSQNVDESEVESHINSAQHKESKTRLAKIENKGSDSSVVKVWLSSFGKN